MTHQLEEIHMTESPFPPPPPRRTLNKPILFVYCFTSHSRKFYSNGDFTITGEELQDLGSCFEHSYGLGIVGERGGLFRETSVLVQGLSFDISSKKNAQT